jgi:hypothetical protein
MFCTVCSRGNCLFHSLIGATFLWPAGALRAAVHLARYTERLPYKASDLSVWNAVLWPGGKKMKRRVAIGAARVYHFPPPPVSRLHLGRRVCVFRTRLIVQEVPS